MINIVKISEENKNSVWIIWKAGQKSTKGCNYFCKKILEDINENGDKALIKYTNKFDSKK